jgi:hypothetical protein
MFYWEFISLSHSSDNKKNERKFAENNKFPGQKLIYIDMK